MQAEFESWEIKCCYDAGEGKKEKQLRISKKLFA